VIPFVAVTVDGKEVLLPPGAPLRQALNEAGVKNLQSVLETLEIERPYGQGLRDVEFSRAADDILGLRLDGGEVIRWQTVEPE
jgi:hypothetical protein